ncbi:MAG: acyl carrier protein [Neisseriaceae bacterium]|nr:acyl carrier protein [Neisseriaceae bacterium]
MSTKNHDFVMKILRDTVEDNINFNMDDELYANYGFDSREFINLIRRIEEYIGHDINDEDLLEAELITVQDLINFVDKINCQ